MHTDTEHKQAILRAAVRLAKRLGFRKFLRRDVALEACTATGTVSYHYRDMDGLRTAVMRHAIENEVLEIVAQGLAERHVLALKAPEGLKRRAAQRLV
jgi:DNA-binding transcriptional regulator YbjK